ncbi:MAG: putative glyoxalase superfamily metalloenzyme YdcJ [Cellvibrionaceae bacterium]|jgi:uncharacterized glyoxalase superfamily metalloenzyme YdcJ
MVNTLHTDDIRSRFSSAMSAMYRQEVPLYSDLIDLVKRVNNQVLNAKPLLKQQLIAANELNRIDIERHGAIRLGTGVELNNIRRLFAVMGMYPVGYYDLSVAGLPVHSTAFRPTDKTSLSRNPFRVFTSLLRLELIEDRQLAKEAEKILSKRKIMTTRALELIDIAELNHGLNEVQTKEFIDEALETFRWHSQATVNKNIYQRLRGAHGLIADVVSFHGPHINHLTPRALDIDLAQQAMIDQGLAVKATIEGPPCRQTQILLRQTSFKALAENITFLDDVAGMHTARFGEIEQRGAALTKKGRDLYDKLLNSIDQDIKETNPSQYSLELVKAFELFPNDIRELHDEKLAFFKYHTDIKALITEGDKTLKELIDIGALILTPQIYEDFLPVSAAGIFQSNLNNNSQSNYTQQSNQKLFEESLGANVIDEMTLYKEIEESSLKEALFVIESEKIL